MGFRDESHLAPRKPSEPVEKGDTLALQFEVYVDEIRSKLADIDLLFKKQEELLDGKLTPPTAQVLSGDYEARIEALMEELKNLRAPLKEREDNGIERPQGATYARCLRLYLTEGINRVLRKQGKVLL